MPAVVVVLRVAEQGDRGFVTVDEQVEGDTRAGVAAAFGLPVGLGLVEVTSRTMATPSQGIQESAPR